MKKAQIATKNDKFKNKPNFSRFYAAFVKFSSDFLDQNVVKVQQRMNLLSNRVVQR